VPSDAAEVQNFTFSIPHWSSRVEFGMITGYYDPDQFLYAGRQDMRHGVPISTFHVELGLYNHNSPTLQTDRQTDGRHG